MKCTVKNIKKQLKKSISEISSDYWKYVNNPSKDFSRNRKLSFEKMIRSILAFGGEDLKCEMMDFFGFDVNLPTISAFVQKRSKISHTAFEKIYHDLLSSCKINKTYKGYRLIAVDGSDLHTPTNPKEAESYYPGTNGQKHYNLMHLNAMYDIMTNLYVDALVQTSRKANEYKAFVTMVDRDASPSPTIYIADRGYESYNNLAHVQEKGQKFLIRVKDCREKGNITRGLELPIDNEFDVSIDLSLTRKNSEKAKNDKNLRCLSHSTTFDYLPEKSKRNEEMTPYILSCRFVRIKISEDNYEMLITNLSSDEFSPLDLKQLYSMRWGIETSFRTLKRTQGLIYFHSKKAENILQEVFAKLIMYNFTEMITSHVVIKQKKRKLTYKVNFSAAIHICSEFFLKNISPQNVEALILKHLIPIRESKPNTCKPDRQRSSVSFLYRIA